MPLGMEIGLGPGDFVLDGDTAPPKKGQRPPIFGPRNCGQTAGWIKMPLCTEVGLGLRDFVLDGNQLPSPKGAQPLIFGQCLLWPNGWMD